MFVELVSVISAGFNDIKVWGFVYDHSMNSTEGTKYVIFLNQGSYFHVIFISIIDHLG